MGREDVILLVCGKGRGLFVWLVRLIECTVCMTVGVGVACGLAQIGFAAQVAAATAAASTVGALQQTGCAIVEHRLGTVFQEVTAAQLRHGAHCLAVAIATAVVVVVATWQQLLLLLLQLLQQSQAAHAAVAFQGWRRRHWRYDVHIRQAGRVTLQRRRTGGSDEVGSK